MLKKSLKTLLSVVIILMLIINYSIVFAESGDESQETGESNISTETGGENGNTEGEPSEGDPSGNFPEGDPPGDPPDGDPPGDPPDGPGGGGSTQITYSGATVITSEETQTNQTYTSEAAKENALLISTSDNVTINNPTVTKTGDSDGTDNDNFYGVNSGILAKDGGTTTITGGNITCNATGGNGIFSYGGMSVATGSATGDGTTINISETTITTDGYKAGGIMATGGGAINASNLTINTAGISSAAIKTDRGGGTIIVEGGEYNTTGAGSPSIYSTGDVTVSNATLTSTKSEAVVVEGGNSVTFNNCTVISDNSELYDQAQTYDNIKMCRTPNVKRSPNQQPSIFTMTGGSMVCKTGNMFHVTNTTSIINLTSVKLTNSSSNVFLDASADGWGQAGTNGGYVTVNATNQNITGDTIIDNISTLTMNLNEGSKYTGTINGENTAQSINLVLDSTSKLTLTGDSYVTSLTNDGVTNNSNINLNGYTLYVNGTPITSTDYIPEPKDIKLENKTSGLATVTIDGETSGSDITVTTEEETFTVKCSRPCIVLSTRDNGNTYERLSAIAISEENKYNFNLDADDNLDIIIALSGDVNLNGSVNASDAMMISRASISPSSSAYQALSNLEKEIADVNRNGSINASDAMLINRSQLSNTASAYLALTW